MFDFLPKSEKGQVTWFEEFVQKLKGMASPLGLTSSEVDNVSRDSNVLSHLVKQTESAPTTGVSPETLAEMDRVKDWMKNGPSDVLLKSFPTVFTPVVMSTPPGIVRRLLERVASIKASPQYTPRIGEALDILTPDNSPSDAFLPRGDNQLVGWYRTFVKALPNFKEPLGLTDANIADCHKDQETLSHLVTEVDMAINDRKATEHFQDLVDYKEFMKWGVSEKTATAVPGLMVPGLLAVVPGIWPRLLGFLERLKGLPGFTTTIGEKLGLLAPAAAAGIPMPAVDPVPEVAPVSAPVPESGGTRWLIPAALALLALMAGILWPRFNQPSELELPSLVSVMASRKTDDVLMLCERGTEAWLKQAGDEFNQRTRGSAHILLTSLGSREGRDHILYDKEQVHPAIWNPADIYWINKLETDVANPAVPNKSGATVEPAAALLKTYLVIAMREDKAKLVETAMQGDYKGKTWALLRDLSTKGWTTVSGSGDKLRLAQSDPTTSNSAMTALMLMYLEFERSHPGKDVNSKEFIAMMKDIEGSVGKFSPSTTEAVEDFVANPDKYDAVIAYESDIIRAIEKGLKGVYILYPAPTAEVLLPASVVKADWVNSTQKKLADEFIAYLLQDNVQARAIDQGYRPASPTLADKVKAAYGVPGRQSVGMVVAPDVGNDADTKTKEGLIYLWNQEMKGGAP